MLKGCEILGVDLPSPPFLAYPVSFRASWVDQMGRQSGELKAEREAELILPEGSGGLARRENCQREMGRGERGQHGEGCEEGWQGRLEKGEERDRRSWPGVTLVGEETHG